MNDGYEALLKWIYDFPDAAAKQLTTFSEKETNYLNRIDKLENENKRLQELMQRTVWHAEQLHLVLPPEMVKEFRAALKDLNHE
jgi:hypothetical protein